MRIRCLALAISLAASSALADDRIRVAVIDAGLDVTHPEIREVLCPTNEHYDAITRRHDLPHDEHGHGTHVAGIIRALAGEKGYCLAACKYYSKANPGSINLRNTVRCLRWAKSIGAEIVNYSGGGPEFSDDERAALVDLLKSDDPAAGPSRPGPAVIVTAAGNEGQDLDVEGQEYYPASYNLPGQIIVGSVDIRGVRPDTSNYGGIVGETALGVNVYSTLPDSRFGTMSGTSQATAVVSGLTLRRLLGLPVPMTVLHDQYWDYFRDFWKALR